MSKPPSRTQDQFIVRLPDGMRDRIKAAAEANNRSMNAEIVATLEEKYPPLDSDEGMVAAAVSLLRSMPDPEGRIRPFLGTLLTMPPSEAWPYAMHFVRVALGEAESDLDPETITTEVQRLREKYRPKKP